MHKKCFSFLFSVFLFAVAAEAQLTSTISFTAPTTNADGSPLTDLNHYDLCYGTSSGSFNNCTNIGTSTSLSYGFPGNGPYYVVVRAVDLSGNKSADSNVAIITAAAPTPSITATPTPIATTKRPRKVKGKTSQSSLTLSWDADPAAINYQISKTTVQPTSTLRAAASRWTKVAITKANVRSYRLRTSSKPTSYIVQSVYKDRSLGPISNIITFNRGSIVKAK
jgi:hypothetical protein